MLKWVSPNCFQVFFQQLRVLSRTALLLGPLNFESHDPWFFGNYSPSDLLQLRLWRYLGLRVFVLVDDVVADPEKLLPFIGDRDQDSSGADNLIGGNLLKFGWIGVSIKGHTTWLDVCHVELVDDLIVA